MNREHAIDRAEFDTAFASRIDQPQQASLNDFVKTELMRVVNDVFDDIDHKSGESLLRLDRLEIDLGEIDLRDYRQQMPQRLRRQLWQALDSARYTGANRQAGARAQVESTDSAQPLFHYLRHGYLPRHATVADSTVLAALLQREIETRPASLVDFFKRTAARDSIVDRLTAQFPDALVERVLRLLEPPEPADMPLPAAEPGQRDVRRDIEPTIEQRKQQFEAALSTDEPAAFERLWRSLAKDDSAMLEKILSAIGRRSGERQALARGLSAEQFNELVRFIEADASRVLLSVFERGHWLYTLARQNSATPAAAAIKLREWLLGYLLVERGRNFDRKAFVSCLLSQIATADPGRSADSWAEFKGMLETPAQAGDISGELARLALAQVERMADQPATGLIGAYQSFARLETLFSPGTTSPGEVQLLADLETLTEAAPWLLLRLLRELQAGDTGWRAALRQLSTPVLQRFGFSFLLLINQTTAFAPSAGVAGLMDAIRRNAARAQDPQNYHVEILARLIAGDLIDFDWIVDAGVDPGGDEQSVETSANPQDPKLEEVDRADGDEIASLSAMDPRVGAENSSKPEAPEPVAVDWTDGDDAASLSAMDPSAAPLMVYAELLVTASLATGLKLSARQLRAIKWRFVKTYVDETGLLFHPGYFARVYVEALRRQADLRDAAGFCSLLGQALLQNSQPSTREATRRLIEALDGIAGESTTLSDAGAGSVEEPKPFDQQMDDIAPDEDIHIANAGLVLLAPWLPRLFDQLGLIEDGAFRDRAAAEHAVHCAQFLVDGSTASPEFQLVLNKLLCGVRPGKPIRRSIELSDDERRQLESLLSAVMQHWKALENTSIAGLRESFLQRGGRLQRKHDAWHLKVEARSFDMLLDQVPWSYSTIKFAWMERVIYVDWR